MNTVLKTFIVYFRLLLDKVIDFLYSLYWDSKWQPLPDLDKEHGFLAESAVTLARRIKQRELKSEDLVRAVIARIKQVNPVLNGLVQERYNAALEEAKKVDKVIAAGLSEEEAKKKPFLGVPFTTKESHAVAGFRLTMGLWSRRELRAAEDSDTVVMLQNAGAILVGLTNLPELLIWQETRNPVYGMTNNPHHIGRTPGGSSGAEAALTAAYATTISLCSDIGGSTRMPAFYTGMFGHHPTPGTTKQKGVFFRNDELDTMLAMGFISKHVEDLAPLVKVITAHKASMLDLDRNVDIKNINFYYTESSDDHFVSPMRSELKDAMTRVINKIKQEVPSTNTPKAYYHSSLDHMYNLWAYMMTKEPDDYVSMYHNFRGEANFYVEFVKKIFGLSKHCFASILRLGEIQVFSKIMPLDPAKGLLEDLKKDLFAKLGDNGVLLFPSAPHPAPYHYSFFLRPWNFAYWALVNALKCPATQVPLGVNSQGLPLGIQVVAAPYNDALCLAVAAYLEQEFGGAVMSCKIKK